MTSFLRNASGATYLFVMLAVVLMGISVSVVAKQWKAVVQREQEAEFLARGFQWLGNRRREGKPSPALPNKRGRLRSMTETVPDVT